MGADKVLTPELMYRAAAVVALVDAAAAALLCSNSGSTGV
jgi:hypothetical protein